MRLQRSRRREMPENTIPLINVVFLLLIFFMLAGRVSQPEPFDVTPPESASREQPGERESFVYIGADGQVAVGTETVGLDDLPGVLADARGDSTAPVRVKADAQAEANRVIAVMSRLKAAGVNQIVLLTRPGGGS